MTKAALFGQIGQIFFHDRARSAMVTSSPKTVGTPFLLWNTFFFSCLGHGFGHHNSCAFSLVY